MIYFLKKLELKPFKKKNHNPSQYFLLQKKNKYKYP